MLWKTKKKSKEQSKIILGMVMLNDKKPFNLKRFLKDYSDNYENLIIESEGGNSAVSFKIDKEIVALLHMPLPIPSSDIQKTSKYAYNWETAFEDLQDHKGHIVVTLSNDGKDTIKLYRIFTQLICSLLRTTNSIGVYKGSQSLLIPKDDYLNEAALMTHDYLPLNIWIYIGLTNDNTKNSGYTYGLTEFGKKEIEVINSSKSLENVRGILFNISHYLLEYDVDFKEGQTFGLSEKEKNRITFSKGKFVTGETLKLEY